MLSFKPTFSLFSFTVIKRLSDFPGGSDSKASVYNVEDPGSVPGCGRSPGEGHGYPLQYSGLEKSMDCVVHGVAKSQTGLSDFHFHFQGLREGGWGVTA